MRAFEEKDYKVFDLFNKQWALVTAGDADDYNTCTISWGSLGTIWGDAGQGRPIATVYVNPDRYTWEYLKKNDTFTISFLPEGSQDTYLYLGSHSGRDEDKVKAAGLTPKPVAGSMTFEESRLTFICKKLYQGPFEREGLAEEISGGLYANWQPHWLFVGEILSVEE